MILHVPIICVRPHIMSLSDSISKGRMICKDFIWPAVYAVRHEWKWLKFHGVWKL